MTRKLTLTIDSDVVFAAQKYANLKGESLSAIVEKFLRVIAQQENPVQLSIQTLKMMGSVNLPEDFDYQKELANALIRKYR